MIRHDVLAIDSAGAAVGEHTWLNAAPIGSSRRGTILAHARHAHSGAFFDWASFASQQAAEKAVKAVLQRAGAEAWGHSVTGLLEEVARATAVPDEVVEAAKELDKAYIPARYPDAFASGTPARLYTRGEAERLVDHAELVVRFCEGLLSPPQS